MTANSSDISGYLAVNSGAWEIRKFTRNDSAFEAINHPIIVTLFYYFGLEFPLQFYSLVAFPSVSDPMKFKVESGKIIFVSVKWITICQATLIHSSADHFGTRQLFSKREGIYRKLGALV